MANQSEMPPLDMAKEFPKLSESDQHFIKKVEQMNLDRAKDIRSMRGRNKLTGLLLGAGVLGIYFYTMYAVRQERFLDDFDEVPGKDKKES